MSEQVRPQKETEVTTVAAAMSFAEFLETVPPSQDIVIENIFNSRREIIVPELKLYCGDELCGGTRFFSIGKTRKLFFH
ncbi:hypothetical protein NKW43_05735 [Gluconobacter albidus]|uniref:hypothetical protein n=1 Tax=Gluconobacter albidus TaxID=318683 RepID=UPI00209F5934|nr:hypothetical protein [Gluconobacter albidus]MCP1273185.1 hypothetical protein [Gluconobacter albidus]